MPRVEPVRVIHLPTQSTIPRFEVAGPVIAGDLAIVASSQFGFTALDYHTGTIAWTKPSGSRIAPPIVVDDLAYLIGECTAHVDVPRDHDLLGCMRIVTLATGTDRAYIAVHGPTRAFAASAGTQDMWRHDRKIRWRRGETAVAIDLVTGVASPADPKAPPIAITFKGKTWNIERTEERIFAKVDGKEVWTTQHPYSVLVGAVWMRDQSPMVRVLRVGPFGGIPEVNVLDVDATGSLHGTAAFPVPGIQLLGYGIGAIGDTVLAVRLDKSIQRDFIAGYANNALLMWVYPLPEQLRPDPVGVAVAPGAVVVFHDGDSVTILPELSAPPTAPGAGASGSSQNPAP